MQNSELGLNNFFQGVVEDRLDPLKLGRVRVRIFGVHTKDKTLLPTNELPWAMIMQSVNSASISGIGISGNGLVEGSWVVVTFLDGETKQKPLVLGTIQGIPEEEANREEGFYDPRTEEELKKYPRKFGEDTAYNFPRKVHANGNTLNESDLHRLAKNENLTETILKKREEERVLSVDTALGLGGEWSEPASRYDAVYPFNSVIETESGHLIELDDTPNVERISVGHRTNTFFEIHPDGSKQERIVKNSYTIVAEDNHVYIKGVCNVTVDGNINVLTNSNLHLETKGNILILGNKDLDIKIEGDANLDVFGNADIFVEGDLAVSAQNASIDIEDSAIVFTGKDTELHQKGNLEILTEGSVLHQVRGNYMLHVDGEVDIRGNPINLNKDKS